MNEQNNLNGGAVQPQPNTQPIQPTPVTENPVSAPVAPVADNVQSTVTEQPVQTTPQQVETTPTQTVQPVQEVAVQQVATTAQPTEVVQQPQVAPTPTVEEVQTVVVEQPQVVTQEAQPAQTVQATETTQIVSQPVQEASVQPVAQVVQAPVTETVQQAPVAVPQPQVVTQEVQTAQTDIVAQAPLNPLANEPVQTANNGVFAPSTPLTPAQPTNGAVDSSNVGFVAVSAPPKKKKNKPLIITIVLAILIGLAALGYFVIYPFVVNKFFSDPKKVYETVIKTAFNELSTNVSELVHEKAIYDLQFSFDSNMPMLESYGGYTYGFNLGADPDNETVQSGFTVINNNVGHSYNSYLKDDKQYLRYSTNRDLIYAGEANLEELDALFGVFSFSDVLNAAKHANGSDASYLINKFADLLVGSIDDSKLSKEEASLVVNGKTIKVFNHKYQIDAATAEAMVKHIVTGLADDDKAIDIIAQMLEMESSTLKASLKALTEEAEEEVTEEEEEPNDTVLTFSIYTTMGIKPSVVGYGLKTSENDSTIHYYKTDDYFEFKVYLVNKDTETNKEIKNTFDIIGKTSNGKTKVSVNLNDKELMSIDVKDWTDTKKEIDYTLMIDEESTSTGSLKYTKNLTDDKLKSSFEFSLEMGEQIIAVIVDFSIDWKTEVANINTNNAVTLSDDQINEQHQNFLNEIYETPIGELFKTVSGDVTPGIGEYYDGTNNVEDPLVSETPIN